MHTRISTCSGCLSILYIKWLVWVDHEVVDPSSSVSMERGFVITVSGLFRSLYSPQRMRPISGSGFTFEDYDVQVVVKNKWLNCNELTNRAESRYTTRYLYRGDIPPAVLFRPSDLISHMGLADNATFSGPSLRIVDSQDGWLGT